MTVCLDFDGAAGATPDLSVVEDISHIAVVDQGHLVDAAFGIVNVPMAVWIDEDLQIVRPAEYAWPGKSEKTPPREIPDEIPERLIKMSGAASQIGAGIDREFPLKALRDWAAKGTDSAHVMNADDVVANSVPRGFEEAQAAAHFELAQELHRTDNAVSAVAHFREAHRLDPGNWTYKRQAWELASRIGGPLSRFWQGPVPGHEDDWPYDGDWLTDILAAGPENYYPPQLK